MKCCSSIRHIDPAVQLLPLRLEVDFSRPLLLAVYLMGVSCKEDNSAENETLSSVVFNLH